MFFARCSQNLSSILISFYLSYRLFSHTIICYYSIQHVFFSFNIIVPQSFFQSSVRSIWIIGIFNWFFIILFVKYCLIFLSPQYHYLIVFSTLLIARFAYSLSLFKFEYQLFLFLAYLLIFIQLFFLSILVELQRKAL